MENNKTAEQRANEIAKKWINMKPTAVNLSYDALTKEILDFASQFKPLSKVGEVTDWREVDKRIEKAKDDLLFSIWSFGQYFAADAMASCYTDLHNTVKKAVNKYTRSLLQPQPVNSEGKGKADNYSKIHSALFELVKLKDYKDANGKTEAYVKKQKEAWEYAKQVLSVSSEGKKELVGNFCQASKVSNGFNDEQPTFEQGKKEGVKYFAENNQYWREMRFNGQIIKSEITKKEFVELINCLESDTVVEQVEAKEPTDETIKQLKEHHRLLGIYLANEDISHHDFGELSERLLPNLYDTLNLLFRSSEVKEQEITVEKIIEMLHLQYQKLYSETKPGQVFPVLPDKWVEDFLRSLQVKSNEQTKTV